MCFYNYIYTLAHVADDRDEQRCQVGPEVGPTPAFSRCVPTGMHGPTCIVWAKLTAFSRAEPEIYRVDPQLGSTLRLSYM